MLASAVRELVIVKLEERSPYSQSESTGPLLSGQNILSEVKPIYGYIDDNIVEAANEMLLITPIAHLTYKLNNSITPVKDTERPTTGSIAMPQDYLRLHSLQMSDWKKICHETYLEHSQIADLQDVDWCMGHEWKPIVIECNETTGATTGFQNVLLKYYSTKSATHVIKVFKYIPKFSATDTSIDYKNNVAELIALNCAKKIYNIFGNKESAAIMEEEIKSTIELARL